MRHQPNLDNITGTAQEPEPAGRLPEDELEFWWTETRPYDPDWVGLCASGAPKEGRHHQRKPVVSAHRRQNRR